MISKLRYAFVSIVCLTLAVSALAGDKPYPKVFEWIEQPVAMLTLDSQIMHKTVDGSEINYLTQEIVDSIFVADMIGLLAKEDITNFSLIPEAVLEEDPEVIRLLTEVRAELSSVFHEYVRVQEELARYDYVVESEDSKANFREFVSLNELAVLLADYTERDYLAIPIYSGFTRDAAMSTKKMAGNLLKGLAQAAVSGTNQTALLDDVGNACLGIVIYDLRDGKTQTVISAVNANLGYVKPALLRGNLQILASHAKGVVKKLKKHNKKARKKIAKLEKKKGK